MVVCECVVHIKYDLTESMYVASHPAHRFRPRDVEQDVEATHEGAGLAVVILLHWLQHM